MSRFINEQHARVFDETSTIPGWQLPGDTELLFSLGYKFGDVILEIGTYAGRSATVALKGALSAGRRPAYYGVDIDEKSIRNTAKTLSRFKLCNNATLFEGTLASFSINFYVAPTMVFVDGDHSYNGALADLRTLQQIVRPGTPIMCHDYLNPDTPGVRQAVDEWADAGWASPGKTDGCSILVIASDKCAGGTARSFLRFHWMKMLQFFSPHVLNARATLQLRTRMRRLARYITRQ